MEIINETEDFIIINKPTGLVVHPGAGNTENTLVNMLIAKYKDLPNSDTDRPGIVHRIDKDTSGVMIIAKTNKFYQNIIVQFENREIEKTYVAILEGNPEKRNGMINLPLGRDTNDRTKQTVTKVKSKEAVSIYHTLQEFEKHSLVEFKILTGRTHQIRVHAQYMGNSVLNDPIYSKKHMAEYKEFGQFLHAKAISFKNLAGEEVVFTTEEPTTFTDVLKNL
ncbi:MAG: RluA family pseudouridine synthase [Tenericutes bacterium]|nr:MAG: RluA family pseudouridine synthase [Mycoplasmatota bacterium]